jgi:hypothetical protein
MILLALKATAIVGACKDGSGNIFCLFYTWTGNDLVFHTS